MKRLFLILLLGVFLLSACAPQNVPTLAPAESSQPASTAPAGITLTDALGRQVTLPKPPTRIVITGKALFMLLDGAYMFPEASQRIVGMGSAAQGTGNFIEMIDTNYTAKTMLQQDAGAEQIAALQPDLVILKSVVAETLGKSIETLNIPVVYVDFETPEQYERDLTILGQVFQNGARARQVISFYQSKVAEIQSALQGVENKPRVLMLYYSDKDGAVAFNVPSMSWMQSEITRMAGGDPVWGSANPSNGWAKVTLEQIAAWDADQIFVISYFKDPSEVVANLRSDPQWQALRAVQEGHFYAFPADVYSWDQPDARWILGLSWMAARLYPDRFASVDILQEAKVFYQTLYGLDEPFFEKNILPTFKGDVP